MQIKEEHINWFVYIQEVYFGLWKKKIIVFNAPISIIEVNSICTECNLF